LQKIIIDKKNIHKYNNVNSFRKYYKIGKGNDKEEYIVSISTERRRQVEVSGRKLWK